MKKIISLLLVVVLSLGMLASVNVFANEKADDLVFDGVSISLSDSIAMNFYVSEDITEKYDEIKLYVSLENRVDILDLDEDYYFFSFSNITPDLMSKDITFKMVATLNGVTYENEEKTYSVGAYLYDVLALYNVASVATENIKICRLVIDTLNYGAGTEKYVNPSLEDSELVNAKLSTEWKAWRGEPVKEYTNVKDPKYVTIDSPSVAWKSATLNLYDKVRMKINFETESIEDLYMEVRDDKGQLMAEASAEDFVSAGGNTYTYTFSRVAPSQFASRLLFTIYKNGVPVSDTLSYSVESFLYSKKTSANAELAKLVYYIGIYGDSSNKYTCMHSNLITHNEVAAKCTVDGCEKYFECADCGSLFSDSAHTKEVLHSDLIIKSVGHIWETTWSSNSKAHFHKCKNCSATADKENHVYDDENDSYCNVCMEARSIILPPMPLRYLETWKAIFLKS